MNKIYLVLTLLIGCGAEDKKDSSPAVPTTTAVEPAELDGQPGAKGDKGDKGDKGEAGSDAEIVSGTMWLDPMTKSFWNVGAVMKFDDGACQGDYRLPTEEEANAAYAHGLFNASQNIAGFKGMWLAKQDQGFHYFMLGSGVVALSSNVNSTFGMICIEDKI